MLCRDTDVSPLLGQSGVWFPNISVLGLRREPALESRNAAGTAW